jgi:hypothetical protein
LADGSQYVFLVIRSELDDRQIYASLFRYESGKFIQTFDFNHMVKAKTITIHEGSKKKKVKTNTGVYAGIKGISGNTIQVSCNQDFPGTGFTRMKLLPQLLP